MRFMRKHDICCVLYAATIAGIKQAAALIRYSPSKVQKSGLPPFDNSVFSQNRHTDTANSGPLHRSETWVSIPPSTFLSMKTVLTINYGEPVWKTQRVQRVTRNRRCTMSRILPRYGSILFLFSRTKRFLKVSFSTLNKFANITDGFSKQLRVIAEVLDKHSLSPFQLSQRGLT